MVEKSESTENTKPKRTRPPKKTADTSRMKTTKRVSKTRSSKSAAKTASQKPSPKKVSAPPRIGPEHKQSAEQPIKNEDRADQSLALWHFAGILFFAGLAAVGLSILSALGIAAIVLRLLSIKAENMTSWQAWILVWLGEALHYIAHPNEELPFPFRQATPPNPQS